MLIINFVDKKMTRPNDASGKQNIPPRYSNVKMSSTSKAERLFSYLLSFDLNCISTSNVINIRDGWGKSVILKTFPDFLSNSGTTFFSI